VHQGNPATKPRLSTKIMSKTFSPRKMSMESRRPFLRSGNWLGEMGDPVTAQEYIANPGVRLPELFLTCQEAAHVGSFTLVTGWNGDLNFGTGSRPAPDA